MRLRETIDWGIDLGTSNSSIAVLEGRDVELIKNNEGDEITPSAVYQKKIGDKILKTVGKVAKVKLVKDHEHVALEFKQKMGMKDWSFKFPSTGKEAKAVDLSAEVLRELVASVKQKTGEDIYAALITVPAAFLDPMYEDTKEAGEKAGIRYVEVLEEPYAAALAYGYGLKTKAEQKGTKRWLAYDLGGGTFDAALVKVEEGVFTVFGHEGIRHLGGKHLDAAIVERFFLPEISSGLKEKVEPWKSSTWWNLKSLAEEAKCQLSTRDEYTVDEDIDGRVFVYTLTRDQLNKLEEEIFSPTIEKCRELLTKNKFSTKGIVEKVILIGGSTLSPHLRKMIEVGLGIPVDFSIDPLTAVARGAAIYACDRKIPDDVLKEIREKSGREQKGVSVHVELNYPATTLEDEVMVAGRLEPKRKGVVVSSEWSVEIKGVDKAGKMLWLSGKIPVSEEGSFAIMSLPVEEGENLFTLVVKDGKGKIVETDREDGFVLRKTRDRPGNIIMPWGVGVADVHGDMIWFFEKSTPLPTEEKTIAFKTTKELKKRKEGDAINIPVVQGNEEKAHLNRVIKTLKINADKLSTTIPKRSNVEVSIKMAESRKVSVNAWFPDYEDVEISATIDSSMDITPEELDKEFKTVRDVCKKLEEVGNYSGRVKQVDEEVRRKGMIDEIERMVSQGTDNPEYRQQGMDKILELKKLLDPVVEDVNELLTWIAHKEYCDKNIQQAKNIVKDIERDERNRNSGIWREWRTKKFEPGLKEYQMAVDNRDVEKTEEIAYSNLPSFFSSAEDVEVWYATREGKDIKIKLPDLVGGGGPKGPDIERIQSLHKTIGEIEL